MGREYTRGEVELMIRTLGFEDARNKLRELEKGIRPNVFAQSMNGVRAVAVGSLGFIAGAFKHFGQTIVSAFYRTVAYGIINMFRNTVRALVGDIKEASETSINLGRSAGIIASQMKKTGDFSQEYDKLLMSITDTANASYLFAQDLAKVNFTLAIAGVRGKAVGEALSLVDKMAAVTGEDANGLAMDFIRLTNAFKIGEKDFGKAADTLISGITNAVMLMPDMLNAVKMLGTTWVLAFGPGLDQLKKFTAAVAALSQVGLKGGMGARYLNRFILGLITPTKQSAALMSVMGVNLWEATDASSTHAAALRTVSRSTRELYKEMDTLSRKRADLITSGKDITEINTKIDATQQKINDSMKMAGDIWDDMITAGGKLKDVDQILKEFNRVMKEGHISTGKLFQIFKELFQMRGMRAVALVNNVDEFLRLLKATQGSAGQLNAIVEGLAQTWGMNLREASVTFSKIRNLLIEVFAAPILGEFADKIKKNIWEPLIKGLKEGGRWKEIQQTIKERVGGIFDNLTSDLGTFLELLFVPPKGTDRTSKEYKEALSKAFEGITENLKPLFSLVADAFRELGKLAGQGFIAAFGDAISEAPFFRHFTAAGQMKEMAQSEFIQSFVRAQTPENFPGYPGSKQYTDAIKEFWTEMYKIQEGIEAVNIDEAKLANIDKFLGFLEIQGLRMSSMYGHFENISSYEDAVNKLLDSLITSRQRETKVSGGEAIAYAAGGYYGSDIQEAIQMAESKGSEFIEVFIDEVKNAVMIKVDDLEKMRAEISRLKEDIKARPSSAPSPIPE